MTTTVLTESLDTIVAPERSTPAGGRSTLRLRLLRVVVGLVAALGLFGSSALVGAPEAEAAPVQQSFTCSGGQVFYMLGIRANANVVSGGQYVTVRYHMADAYGRTYTSGWDTVRWTPQYNGYATGWSHLFNARGWVGVTLQYQVAYYYANGWAYSGWYTLTGSRLCDPRY